MLKYYYIAVEGSIGAGKTTLATILAQKFSANLLLEKFEHNPFLPLFYSNPERHALPVELFFMAERFKQLKDMLAASNTNQHATISDFSFQKSLIFSGNNLSENEKMLYQMLFEIMLPSLPQPDVIVYLHASVEQLLKNIKQRGRAYEQAIQPKYLEAIQQAYLNYFSKMTKARIVMLDTSKFNFLEKEEDAAFVVKLLESEIEQGITKY